VRSLHSDLHLQTHGGLIHLAEAEILVHYFRVIYPHLAGDVKEYSIGFIIMLAI